MLPGRCIARGAIVGAVAASLGWVVSECLAALLWPQGRWFAVAATCGTIGTCIAAALEIASAERAVPRGARVKGLLAASIAGALAGSIGGGLGNVSAALHGPRAFGWMIMGAGIGSGGGLSARSIDRLRFEMVGGLAGGLLGGFLFGPIASTIGWLTLAGGRLAAFAVLGASIGCGIGLARDLLIRAWLTVIEGDRPGRQVVLSRTNVSLGGARHATLPLLGPDDATIDEEHARVVRRPDGRFVLEDNRTRLGTRVNRSRVVGTMRLNDCDVIRIGPHAIEFRERKPRPRDDAGAQPDSPPVSVPTAPPDAGAGHLARPTTTKAPDSPGQKGSSPPKPVRSPMPQSPPPAPAPARDTTATGPTRALGPTPRGMSRCSRCGRLLPVTDAVCTRCQRPG
jgi:hypothetical protein